MLLLLIYVVSCVIMILAFWLLTDSFKTEYTVKEVWEFIFITFCPVFNTGAAVGVLFCIAIAIWESYKDKVVWRK